MKKTKIYCPENRHTKEYFVFTEYQNLGEKPDIFVSPHNNYEYAIYEFVVQTLGYQITKITSESQIEAEQV